MHGRGGVGEIPGEGEVFWQQRVAGEQRGLTCNRFDVGFGAEVVGRMVIGVVGASGSGFGGAW